MDEVNIAMDTLSSWPLLESTSTVTSTTIYNTGQIGKALEIIDAENLENWQEFIDPWGPEKITLVHLSAYLGSVNMLIFADDVGMDLYAADGFNRRALHWAAAQDHSNVVRWLLKLPAVNGGPKRTASSANDQVWLRDSSDMTALDVAKAARHYNIAKVLMKACIEWKVDRKLRIQRFEHDSTTYNKRLRNEIPKNLGSWKSDEIFFAAYCGKLGMLENATDLDVKDELGRSALHYAAEQGHLNVVQYLVARPGTATQEQSQLLLGDSLGMIALHHAAEQGHLSVVKYLVERPGTATEELSQLLFEDSRGMLALHHAAEQGHMNVVEYLVERQRAACTEGTSGAELSQLRFPLCPSLPYRETALGYICSDLGRSKRKYFIQIPVGKYKEAFPLLLQDSRGMSALHYAAAQGHIDIVQYLMEPPVAAAGEPSDKESSQLLLKNSSGRTALHLAVEGKHVAVVKFLVNADADVNAKDNNRDTPFFMAHCNVTRDDRDMISRYEEIIDFLISKNACGDFDPIAVLHQAIELNSRKAMQQVCKYYEIFIDDQWEPPYEEFSSAVHTAASYGSNEALRVLLDFMPPSIINGPDSETGLTPLHTAAWQHNLECIRLLINAGGNLAKKNSSNCTVIDVLSKQQDNVDIVAFFIDILSSKIHLLRKNADSNLMDEESKGRVNISSPRVPDISGRRDSQFVALDFRVLGPENELQMAVISTMIAALPRKAQIPILQHPLVRTYITLKWLRLRYFFGMFLIIRLLFAGFLFGYALRLQENNIASILRGMMFSFAMILLCYNTLQLSTNPKRYIKKVENWLHSLCLIIAIRIAVDGFATNDTNAMAWWIPYSLSVLVPLVWIQTMLLVGSLSDLVITLVFPAALMNFLKVFSIGFLWIIGFACSFSVLMHGKDESDNLWKAVVKSVLMMTGEYDVGNLFGNETKSIIHNHNAPESETLYGPIISRAVLLIFVILISIVLMNLTIGLAVSDIQGLVKEGDFSRLLRQAEVIAECEWMSFARIFGSSRCVRNMLGSSIPEVLKGKPFPLLNLPTNFPEKLRNEVYNIALKNKEQQEVACHNEESGATVTAHS